MTVVEKTFCTTEEASKLLGVSAGTIQSWVDSGLLEAWKTAGGHRRIIRDSIDKLLTHAPERKLKVIVVEDSDILALLYKSKIANWPFQVDLTIVANGFAALMLLGDRRKPDLMILDLGLPCMDGFQMLKVLSSTPDMQDVHYVVVTGMDTDEITAKGGVPQSVEILQKPVPFDRLKAIAQEIVTNKVKK